MIWSFIKQVLFAPDKRAQRRDQLLPDGIQRRIGHLGEQLLEVMEEHLVLV